jgi:hypothetical protein
VSSRVAASSGDRWRGSAGFPVITVVLVNRIDCRSRRAARGPSRPRAKSPRITTRGLAVPRESAGVVKKRRKPDRWPSEGHGIGGGLPMGWSRERSAHHPSVEHSLMEGALGRETALFDEGAAEAALVPRGRLGFRPRAGAGRDRERQKPFASFEIGRERLPRSGGTRVGCLPASPLAGGEGVSCAKRWKLASAVKRIASRGWIAARRSGAGEGVRSTARSSRLLAVGAA